MSVFLTALVSARNSSRSFFLSSKFVLRRASVPTRRRAWFNGYGEFVGEEGSVGLGAIRLGGDKLFGMCLIRGDGRIRGIVVESSVN